MYIRSLFFLLILAGTSATSGFNKRHPHSRGLRSFGNNAENPSKTHRDKINSDIDDNDNSDSDNEDDTKVTDESYFAKKQLNSKLKGAQTREKWQRSVTRDLKRGKYARIEVDDFFADNEKHSLNKQRRNQEVNSSDLYDSGDGDSSQPPSSMPSFMSLPISSSEDETESSSSDGSSNRKSNKGKGNLKKKSNKGKGSAKKNPKGNKRS